MEYNMLSNEIFMEYVWNIQVYGIYLTSSVNRGVLNLSNFFLNLSKLWGVLNLSKFCLNFF